MLSLGLIASVALATILVACLKKDAVKSKTDSFAVVTNTGTDYSARLQTGENTLVYTTQIVNGKFISSLQITANETSVYRSTYELDPSVPDFRLLQHGNVENIARTLPGNLSLGQYDLLAKQCRALLEDLFSRNDITKEHAQSLFFHYAVLTTKVRGMASGNYECLPHPGYILGRTFFWDQQDFLVDVNTVKGVFQAHPELLNNAKGKNLFAYINTIPSGTVSYDKIYSFSVQQDVYLESLQKIVVRNKAVASGIDVNVAEAAGGCAWWCPLGCGSDWGCCGNYSGCCLYASLECYVHDAICTNCTPAWFCLPGCVPDKA